MRSAGIYLIEVQIGKIRNAFFSEGQVLITLRIGRNSASTIFTNPTKTNELLFNTSIQLNVDHSALETQRCSISFNGPDKRIVGIALISIPKDKNFLQNTYRLTQNEDKRAEIEVKLKISPFQSTSASKYSSPNPKEQAHIQLQNFKENKPSSVAINILPNKQQTFSNNPEQSFKLKSKISEQLSFVSSEDRKTPRSFKVRQDDRVVQTSEKALKRYKDEKEAYYHLYQIQKSKNEVATKFIGTILKKIGEKFPSLLSAITQSDSKKSQNGQKKNHKNQPQIDSARLDQLEQANRSLHRQVEQYKKIIEQLKGDIPHPAPPLRSKQSNFLLAGIFDQDGTKSGLNIKSNIKSSGISTIKEEPKPKQIDEIDFKKWLNQSIGQRESIQNLLGTIVERPTEKIQKNENAIKKLRASIDRIFSFLMTKKEVPRDTLINHKKEVNILLEQIAVF